MLRRVCSCIVHWFHCVRNSQCIFYYRSPQIKKDVENELASKREIQLLVPLSTRQRQLYKALRARMNFRELNMLHADTGVADSILNLVMQFRKVKKAMDDVFIL